MKNNLSVLKYRDPDTGRYRWAVYQYGPAVWYFPKRYGIGAARRLLRRLNTPACKTGTPEICAHCGRGIPSTYGECDE